LSFTADPQHPSIPAGFRGEEPQRKTENKKREKMEKRREKREETVSE